MKKRLLAIIATLAMVVAMMPSMVFGAEVPDCSGSCSHEAAIGTTHYDTIQEAIDAASSGDTVTLLKDIQRSNAYNGGKLDERIVINAGDNIILDLNGKTIEQYVEDVGLSVALVIVRQDATLTVKDSVGGGKISACTAAVQLTGTLNLQSGTIACDSTPSKTDQNPAKGDYAYPVWIYIPNNSNATPEINMTGGSLEYGNIQSAFTYSNAICYDGASDLAKDVTVSISGGIIEGTIYIAGDANMSITGGTFEDDDVNEYIDTDKYIQNEDGTVVEKTPASEGTTAPTTKPDSSPNTGDNSVAPFAVAGLVLAAMAAAVVARRRYN